MSKKYAVLEPAHIGTEVDALALMLEGVHSGGSRFARMNVEILEAGGTLGGGAQPPLMERTVTQPEWYAVAEAILELEGNAAAWLVNGPRRIENGALAMAAWARAGKPDGSGDSLAERIGTRYLEAAAILRDGWRPRRWKAREK